MRKIFSTATVFAACLIFVAGGCTKVKYEKDPRAYYPKVHTSGATVAPDGSVTVSGVIESAGSGPIRFAGFCMDTAPDPEMHINQALSDGLAAGRFEAVYATLDGRKTYYFRSFAANEFGYAYGGNVVVERPGMDTSTIPCHPGSNQIVVDLGWGSPKKESLIYLEEMDSYNRVEASSSPSSYGLRFEFARKPTTGKYKIWENPSRGTDLVEVFFLNPGGGAYRMDNGGEVYVQQVDDTRIRIWVCEQRCGERKITACFTSR